MICPKCHNWNPGPSCQPCFWWDLVTTCVQRLGDCTIAEIASEASWLLGHRVCLETLRSYANGAERGGDIAVDRTVRPNRYRPRVEQLKLPLKEKKQWARKSKSSTPPTA